MTFKSFKHSAAINWNDLPSDIRACDSANVLNVNLRLIFSTLPMLPIVTSLTCNPRAYTSNIPCSLAVTYAALQVSYCTVLYKSKLYRALYKAMQSCVADRRFLECSVNVV